MERSPIAGDLALCVALIGLDENKDLIISACNNAFFRLIGHAPALAQTFPISLNALMADVAPPAFRQTLIECFESSHAQLPEQTYDLRSETRWWRCSFKAISHRSGTGSVQQILVTGFDVAADTTVTQKPDANTSRYRALVDLAYDAIVTMDQQHNITLFNRAAENLFGYSSAEVVGRPVVTLLPEQFRAQHPRKVQQFSDSYQPSLRHASPPRMDDSNSVYARHRDGTIIPVEISVSRIDANGASEFMAVVRDVTHRVQLMELLKKEAATDALTGLPNRREFLAFVDKVLASNEQLSVFILDIDFFKEINDEHGHDAGDDVLRVLAKIGMSMAGRSGLFARWGGEEFVAALPGADAKLAHAIAEGLRQRCERQDFADMWRVAPIPFTVSIGVVTREGGEADVDALMKRADRALYRAKNTGRNRVEPG
jgi:diguanylate cyclase (GGDEF)-like protein/PAS domain S-box-containing protein